MVGVWCVWVVQLRVVSVCWTAASDYDLRVGGRVNVQSAYDLSLTSPRHHTHTGYVRPYTCMTPWQALKFFAPLQSLLKGLGHNQPDFVPRKPQDLVSIREKPEVVHCNFLFCQASQVT